MKQTNNTEELGKYKQLVQNQETLMIRTEEKIKNLDSDIEDISKEIRKLGCEPTSKAMKAKMQVLQQAIDKDFEELSAMFNNDDEEDDDDI